VLLTEDQKKIRLNARNFAKKEISPYIRAWEKAGSAPRELYRKMGTVGLMGMTISQEYGGSGLDFVSYVLAVEEISAADGGISNMMSANNSPVAVAIEKFGTETQKQKLLPFLTSGEWLGCIHLTEPHTGLPPLSAQQIIPVTRFFQKKKNSATEQMTLVRWLLIPCVYPRPMSSVKSDAA
jgi:alkylation response protein AidB-like acyl-CoA dehydrogenase